MKPPLRRIAETAVKAAKAAGRELARRFGRRLVVREKPGAGLVSEADFAAEATALRILTREFPDWGLLTEESAPRPSQSAAHARWVLDPLDGTTNFVHGFPMFCVSLAAEWAGELVVGVIYHPILRDLYVGIRGRGATVNGRKLRVSTRQDPEKALLSTGFTFAPGPTLLEELDSFERLTGLARAVRRPGSAALNLAYTARGVFDGFWERRLSPWDFAAGTLLIEEAGGKVTDFSGRKLTLSSLEILATNPALHPQLLRELQLSAPAKML